MSTQRETLSNCCASIAYGKEPPSHRPGAGAGSSPRRTQILCFSLCPYRPSGCRDRGRGAGPRADAMHRQSMSPFKDALPSPPHHGVSACDMEAILHPARGRAASVLVPLGTGIILPAEWLTIIPTKGSRS